MAKQFCIEVCEEGIIIFRIIVIVAGSLTEFFIFDLMTRTVFLSHQALKVKSVLIMIEVSLQKCLPSAWPG